MSPKTYLTILKIGIYFSFLSVFLVYSKLLFPFITSKQIYFNVLIEILFIFWFAFIIKYPEYRPKKNLISIGLVGFFAALLASLITTVDLNLSFWGDVERMLGIFHLLHFLAFYFIIITIMRGWQDWRNLLIASVIAAVLICLYGLVKNIAYSTIGNTAYVSGYAIFNIYFSLILLFRSLRSSQYKINSNNWWIVSLYPVAIIIMLSIFKLTHTRGAYVGMGVSLFVALFLFIILSKSRKIKYYSLSIFISLAILISLIFAYPNSNIVKNSSILSTVTQISSQAVTFQTRLIAWKAAAKDFSNHPFLGTGHGNFAITFDKYFEPTFYNYTRSETYFDRAHNNIVDIASTTGLLGLLTYLFIFVVSGYYLIKGFRKKNISRGEFIFLVGLIIAYFIQNLAVFDSLVTYISLMVMLGFIYWLANQEAELPIGSSASSGLINKEVYALVGVGLIMAIIIFQYNIKPFQMLKGTINGEIAFAQYGVVEGVEAYKKAQEYQTVLDRDSRSALVRSVGSRAESLFKIDKAKAQEILDWTIEAIEKNVQYNPQDSLTQLQLSQILNTAAIFNRDNQEKFYFYSDRALEAVEKSIASSPGRIPIYYSKAQIYATRGENDKALETLRYAASLNEEYYDSYCNLARYNLAISRESEGFTAMDKCLDLGGAGLLQSVEDINNLLKHYIDNEDWERSLKLYQRINSLDPNNVQSWINSAKLYAQLGEKEKAITAAQKSAELDSSMRSAVEEFIKALED